MNNYRNETYKYKELQNQIELPNYQRPLVWSNEQKNNFLGNISRGFPFGSLLLYRYDASDKFTLIDGQQRYTTLQEYSLHPEKYFPFEDFGFIDDILGVINDGSLSEEALTKLKAEITTVIKALIQQEASGEKPKASFLSKKIKEFYPLIETIKNSSDEICDIQAELIRKQREYVDLENLQIPCVIFTGEKSDLPEVFANVNLGGRKLTKYQVFAAQWDRYSVQLTNNEFSDEILDKTIDRYERLTSDRGGLVIEDYSPEEMKNNRVVTLPEFCHALGELILKECDACWPKKALNSDDTIDTIGYNTMAIIFGIHPKEIKEIPEKFALAGFENNGEAIEKLLKDILHEYKEINGRFAQHLKRPGTDNKYETVKTSGQMQFLSFFAALWYIHYGAINSSSYEPLSGYKHKGYEITCKNIFPTFIHDVITNQWKGSGDSRLGNYVNGNFDYKNPISKEKLKVVGSVYLEELSGTESINVDPVAKTLITVFANSQLDKYSESTYDYEHLIPRDTLNKKHNGQAAYKIFNIPGGGLGNIAYLDSKTNQGKGSKTLFDATSELHSFDGSRELLDGKFLSAANQELLSGHPEKAKQLMERRAEDVLNVIIEHLIKD